MNAKKLYHYLVICFLALYVLPAKAVLDIEVTQAIDQAMPIAVVPFKHASEAPTNISEIIAADLKRSGEFDLLPTRRMAQMVSNPKDVDFDYWRRIKMDSLVLGTVTPVGGDRYEVQYHLFDVYQPYQTHGKGPNAQQELKPLLAKKYTVPAKSLRSLAHHISDEIYEKITGVPGAFSSRIAYINVIWKDGKLIEHRLEIADTDGANPAALLTSSEPIMSPAWSPDGRKLAYVSFENKRAQIFVVDVASGRREMVSAKPGINGSPAWSPDGRKLALVLSSGDAPKIHVLDLASKKTTQLTTGWAIDTEPRWAADGKSVFYTSNRGGKPQIYRVRASGGDPERVTFEGDFNARPTPTNDGKYLVYIHRDNGQYKIAVQDLKHNQPMVLTNTKLDNSPSIAPNDRMVMYSTLVGGKRVLSAVSMDGRVKLTIPTREGEVQDPAWSPYIKSSS